MIYNPVNWVNGETPINDTNLNNMDKGIADAHEILAIHDKKIDDFVKEQIPEEYVKGAVDAYVSENEAGLFTKAEAEELNEKIDESVRSLSSEIADVSEGEKRIIDDLYDVELIEFFNGRGGYPAGDFKGYVYPLNDISDIKSIVFSGCSIGNNAIVKVALLKDITLTQGNTVDSLLSQCVAHGEIEVTADVVGRYTIELNTIIHTSENGYLLVCSDEKLSCGTYHNYINDSVLNTDKECFYVNTGSLIVGLDSENFGNYAQVIRIEKIYYTEKECPKVNNIYVSTLGSDTEGDGTEENPYATIYHANEMITDSSYMNQYIINVADGTYTDLQEKYSGMHFTATDYIGVITKDYVSYIGNVNNPEKCIIKWDGSTGIDSDLTARDMSVKCPFHIVNTAKGSMHTKIRGFYFDCQNLRYAIHVESAGAGLGSDWEISNCDLTGWKGNPKMIGLVDYVSMDSIGMGVSPEEKGLIKDCCIATKPSDDLAEYSFDIRVHDNNPYSSMYETKNRILGAKIRIENCDLGGNKIWASSMHDIEYATKNIIEVINCNNVSVFASGTSIAKDNWNGYAICSSIEDCRKPQL